MTMLPWERPSLFFKLTPIPVDLLALALTWFCLSGFPQQAMAQDQNCQLAPTQESQRLRQAQELSIAKGKNLYMILDLTNHSVLLKGKGVVLREFPIESWSWIGGFLFQVTAFLLERKIPSIEPPLALPPSQTGSPLPGNNEVRPLAVEDMPYRYTVLWQGEFSIVIQSINDNSMWEKVWEETVAWTDRVGSHLSSWTGSITGHSPSTLVVELTPVDAQALYWSLVSPMKILVIPSPCNLDST